MNISETLNYLENCCCVSFLINSHDLVKNSKVKDICNIADTNLVNGLYIHPS